MRSDVLPPPIVVAASLLLLGGCGDQRAPESAPPTDARVGVVLDSSQLAHLVIAPAESASFHPTIRTTGTVFFNGEHSTTVVSPISGPVARLMVSLGDHVQPGDVLATVASRDFAAAIAEYRKADAAWRNATRIATLNEKLLATGSLPRAERDQSASDLVQAVADRAAATAALSALGIRESALATLTESSAPTALSPAIRSPIAGTVVERPITPGQLLEAGTTAAFTIADLSTMWVEAQVFATDVSQVRVGDRAELSSEALPATISGTVAFVGALVDPVTRATAVRIVVPNTDRRLRQNMLVEVAIASRESRSGVLVPVSAVLRDDENLPYLFIAEGNEGRFDRRRITLGERVGDRYEITAGIAAGESLVVSGGLYLSAAGASAR